MSTATEIFILGLLIVANGLLAGAEIAVVSIRASRISELIEAGSRAARAVARARARPERFFATVQIGITVIGVTAGAFGGARFGNDLADVLDEWPLLAPYAGGVAYALVVVSITYVSIILGELVPKSLALRKSEAYALAVARPLVLLEWLLTPAVWFLTISSNAVLRLFGDRTDFLEAKVSLEEVRSMMSEAQEKGSLDEGIGSIASRALDLSELTAAEVMVHRRFVRALPIDADAEMVKSVLLEAGHRRLPIYEGTIDNVLGYLSWRDVLERLWSGQPISARDLLREITLVPESVPAAALLRQMLLTRQHLVSVVDEHGGHAGIVTLEDLLEELVGEIESEHATDPELFAPQPNGSVEVAGGLPLRELDRELGLHLADETEATTVAGLLLHLAGDRIPSEGEQFEAGGARFQVVEASPRRVRRVSVERKTDAAAP